MPDVPRTEEQEKLREELLHRAKTTSEQEFKDWTIAHIKEFDDELRDKILVTFVLEGAQKLADDEAKKAQRLKELVAEMQSAEKIAESRHARAGGSPEVRRRRQMTLGVALMTIAVASLVTAILMVIFLTNFLYILGAGIFAMVFGKLAFTLFARAKSERAPGEPIVYDIDLLSSALKNGDQVAVQVALHYSNPEEIPHALPRVKIQLQATLNYYVSTIDRLSADPFKEIAGVLKPALLPVLVELGLRDAFLQVVNVKVSGTTQHSQGIYFGSTASNE